MAAAQPLPVGLQRILLVTVRAGLWSERSALRRRQWTGLPLVVLATGLPLAAVYAVFCGVILSGGLIASVLFGLAVLIAWLIVVLLLKSFFAVAIVMWRWTRTRRPRSSMPCAPTKVPSSNTHTGPATS